MIILIIMLVLFGLSIQVVFTHTHKRNIIKKDYRGLILTLYFDAAASIVFILSVFLNAHLLVQLILQYLIYLSMALFYLVYMNILKYQEQKRKWTVFVLFVLGTFIITFFGQQFSGELTLSLMLIVLFSSVLLVAGKRRYPSRFIFSLVLLLLITEAIRFGTGAYMTYDLLYYGFNDTWVVAFSFFLRAIAVILVAQVHNQLSIDKNLAKVLDTHSAVGLLSSVFDQNPSVVVLTDTQQRILYSNKQAFHVTGYTESELIGQTPKIFSSGQTPKETYIEMNAAIAKGDNWIGEFVNKKKNGEIFIESTKIVTLKDVNGKPMFYLAIKIDITKEKEHLRNLEYLSKHDDLTALLRRQVFIENFENSIQNNPKKSHYFIILDIDEFKFINDNYGHLVGDEVLKEFARALKDLFKENAQVCRFGGDEFAIYIYNDHIDHVNQLMTQLEVSLKKIKIESISQSYTLKFSYGMTKVDMPFDFSQVYEVSDKQLYKNKTSKNGYKRTSFKS